MRALNAGWFGEMVNIATKKLKPFDEDWGYNLRMQPFMDAIYRSIWGNRIRIKRELGALDKDRGIGVINEMPSGLTISLQEKARRYKYRHFQQFTVEYSNNPLTGEKGEFYKLAANYYFYGYAFPNEHGFCEWRIIDLNRFKEAYHLGIITPTETVANTKRSRATFLCFEFRQIQGMVVFMAETAQSKLNFKE